MDEVLKSIDGNNSTKELYYLGKKLQNAMDALVVLDKNISEELKGLEDSIMWLTN